jgi:prepilin-type N-terminal cleavage/methylation domain-containing protein
MSAQSGFTLIEVMVTIAIVTITTVIVATGFPRLRDQQQQLLARQQITSLIREAQQQSINGQRPDKCLSTVAGDQAKKCSQAGLALRGNEYYLFLDTSNNDDRKFTNEKSDFIISHGNLPGGVTVASAAWRSFLFVPDPPSTTLYVDGEVVTPQVPATIVLRQNLTQLLLQVLPSGVVERI